MNPRLEWAIPLVVGLVFGLGLWALMAGSDGGSHEDEPIPSGSSSSTSTGPPPIPDVLAPFAGAQLLENHSVTFVVLAPHGKSAALDAVNRSTGPLGEFAWQSDHVALYSFQAGPWFCCAGRAYADGWPLPMVNVIRTQDAGPLLFREGYNATRVTAYVFDEAGLLVASNANDTARFTLHGDFIRLPSSAWYLGANDTAPPGTAFLPSLAQRLIDGGPNPLRPLLDGLPVSGVASTRSNAYVALYGSLFVTVRIDGLVLAP